MLCPKCSDKSKVWTTKMDDNGNVSRLRHCPDCKYRWTTIEVSENVFSDITTGITIFEHEADALLKFVDQRIHHMVDSLKAQIEESKMVD